MGNPITTGLQNPQTPLNPQLLTQLQQMPQAGLPTPQDPFSQGSSIDPSQVYAAMAARQQGLQPEADQARQAAANMSLPSMGPQIQHSIAPTQATPSQFGGQGMGGVDAGQPGNPGQHASFLHNLGQALQMIAASTKPGAAIVGQMYAPAKQQYAARQQQLATETKDVQAQQELAQRGQQAAGQLELGQAVAGERGRHNVTTEGIKQQEADTHLKAVNDKLAVVTRGLDIRELRAGNQNALDQAKTRLTELMPELKQQALDLVARGQDVRSASEQARDNVISQLGVDKTHPIATWLDSMLGTQLAPGAPLTPGGATPQRGPNPLPKPTSRSSQTTAPARPANVPPDYQFKNGSKGQGWYKPGTN